jgi:hypothetical protein
MNGSANLKCNGRKYLQDGFENCRYAGERNLQEVIKQLVFCTFF